MKNFIFENEIHEEKIKKIFNKDPYFTATGLFFGFNDCCIDGFITDKNKSSIEKYPEAECKKTGFLPCSGCADEACNHWDTFKEKIEQRRLSSLSFPNEENHDERYRFLYHLTFQLGYDLKFLEERYDDEHFTRIINEEEELKDGTNIIANEFLEYFQKKDASFINKQNIIKFCEQSTEFQNKIELFVIQPLNKDLKNALEKSKNVKKYNKYILMAEKRAIASILDALSVMVNGSNIEVYDNTIKPILEDTAQSLYKNYLMQLSLKNDAKQIKVIPTNKEFLKDFIQQKILLEGINCDLNHIDVSKIDDMSLLFKDSDFNGDISKWDVSNVQNMQQMFQNSKFNGDISNWDVSKVKKMTMLFHSSEFNGDISKWNVSNVEIMHAMFGMSKFTKDISQWDVSNVKNMVALFVDSKFNGDISKWDVSNVQSMDNLFFGSSFDKDTKDWEPYNVKSLHNAFKDCIAPIPYWSDYEDQEKIKIAINTFKEKKALREELTNALNLKNDNVEKRIKL